MSAFNALFTATDFLLIGHRGAAGLETENTLPSFQRAIDLGCAAIELDVQHSATTSAQWIIHDSTVDRTTNGHGRVKDLTDAELHKLRCTNNAAIPKLSEVLDVVAQQSQILNKPIGVNVELKGPATAAAVAKTLLNYPNLPVLVSSFDHGQLRRFRDLDQHTDVAPLFHAWHDNINDIASELAACCINLSSRIVTARRCEHIHQSGLPILAYTVNSKRAAKRLQQMGIAGVFTDRPDRFI
ncbi:MAG: hypothetical protein CMP86_01795 [Gammaproteobacteria bacterium]|nr:hypothetical protein [Gammaproteobacteria bacterium]